MIRVFKSHHMTNTGWEWKCTEHIHHRGFHHRFRRTDWYLRRMGKPPDRHPWVTCMEAAVMHYHRYHSDVKCCHPPGKRLLP